MGKKTYLIRTITDIPETTGKPFSRLALVC